MQTFAPYLHYEDSARVLDQKRLGKQRVETLQIMIAIFENRGFIHHPAVHMWRGYERSLLSYQEAFTNEWISRGFVDTCYEKTLAVFKKHAGVKWTHDKPFWIGNIDFHRSHMSKLVFKDPAYYRPRFPTVPDNLEYVWPATDEQKAMGKNGNKGSASRTPVRKASNPR